MGGTDVLGLKVSSHERPRFLRRGKNFRGNLPESSSTPKKPLIPREPPGKMPPVSMPRREDHSDQLATRVSLLGRLGHASDHDGWQRFFDAYWRLLYNVARRAGLGDAEAQDVVQETIIDVSRQMPAFRYDKERGSFKSWLLVIVRRRIWDHFRRQQYKFGEKRLPRSEAFDTALAETQGAPDRVLDQLWAEEWEEHLLNAALARLKEEAPPLQFQAFQLHVLKGLPVEEVTTRLGVKATAVYWAKYRLSRRLKAALQEVQNT